MSIVLAIVIGRKEAGRKTPAFLTTRRLQKFNDIRAIKDDTKWLRLTITSAIIVSVIGGVVAIIFAALK